MRDAEIADRKAEDAAPSPTTTGAAILESLARAEADVAAGRVVEGEGMLAELREMIGAWQAARLGAEALRQVLDLTDHYLAKEMLEAQFVRQFRPTLQSHQLSMWSLASR